MEYVYWQISSSCLRRFRIVLILILMEYVYWLDREINQRRMAYVLILILMEYVYWPCSWLLVLSVVSSLNPYSNGICLLAH